MPLDAYLRHCERRGFSPVTIKHYRKIVTAWLAWLTTHNLDHAGAGPAEIEAFLDSRPHITTVSARATYLGWLRAFCRWAMNEGIAERDPCAKIDTPLVPRRVARPIDESHLAAALATADDRMRAWLLLGAKAGLRCKEIAGIHSDDLALDQSPPMLTITNPKGRKQRQVPLHPDIVAALPRHHGYLWPGGWGRGFISPGHVSRLISEHLHTIDHATAHQLRHRLGSTLFRESRDIRLVQEILGHASPATTQIYTSVEIDRAAEYFDRL